MKRIISTGLILLAFYQQALAGTRPLGEAGCKGRSPLSDYSPPVPGKISHPFGEPRGEKFHSGAARHATYGTPVHPVANGVVVFSGYSSSFGPWVVVRHDSGVFTVYGHLIVNPSGGDYPCVEKGVIVTRTSILGYADDSGDTSDGNHEHDELWTGCPLKVKNPLTGKKEPMTECWDGWEGDHPPSSDWGVAIDPRCGNPDERPDKGKLPPGITWYDYLVVAWTPHDPNAMLGPEGYVTPGQVMTYTVMFENEGQGTAFDVYVTDIFDSNLDDSNISIKDFYLVDWATNTETPTTLPYSYDPQSHKLTVLAGTFDSRQGGKFTVELRLKADVPQGTVVKNFATVYFPTALEETRTNSIISAVPQPALVAYTGSTVAVYSSYAMIAATVTNSGQTLLGKTVNFYVGGSTLTALTGGTGEASVYAQVDAPPGDYELTAAFPGDGYYYTSSTQVVTLQIRKSETYIADFSTVTYSTNPVITVAMTNSKGVQILHQDTDTQTIHLEYLAGETWEPLGQAILSSGTAIFQFPLPQPATSTYHLKAKFNGHNNYFSTESTATLTFVDITPPTVELAVNGVPLEAGATAYIADTDAITLTAEDFGTGPKSILYTRDVDFSTTAATAYAGSFTLPAGTHTVYYTAVDNAGNQEEIHTVLMYVNPIMPDVKLIPFLEFVSEFGRQGANPGEFNRPSDIDSDILGNVYVSDTENKRIQKFDKDHNYISSWSILQFPDWTVPQGIGVSPDNKIGVATTMYGKVQIFNQSGMFLRQTGPDWPNDAVFDKAGNMYIGHEWGPGQKISKYSDGGQLLKTWTTDASYRLAIDSNDNIYAIGIGDKSKVQKFDNEGNLLIEWGKLGNLSGEFDDLRGIAVDRYDNVYTVEAGSYYGEKRIQIFTSTGGYISELSWNFNYPKGIGVNRLTGEIYVTDAEDNKVRCVKVDTSTPSSPALISPPDNSIVSTGAPVIIGRSEPASIIEIYSGGVLIGKSSAAYDGFFRITPNIVLESGTHLLSAYAVDSANHKSKSAISNLTVIPKIQTSFTPPDFYGSMLYGRPYPIGSTVTVTADFNEEIWR